MNKPMPALFLAAMLVMCGFLATKVFAADINGALPAAHGRWLQHCADKLNLTGDQRTQIKAVLVAEKGSLAPLLSSLHTARKQLRTVIQAGDASESSVRAAAGKVAAVEANLAVERMRLYAKITPILTGTQRQQAADLRQHADNLADEAITRFSELDN